MTGFDQAAYDRDGFVVLQDHLAPAEVDVLVTEFEHLVATPSPALILESDGTTVRGHHGGHLVSDVFADLVRLPRFLSLSEDVLGGPVYVHQFKINAKRALVGDHWEWHQDFTFWHLEDGMPRPRAVNFALFLDDVTEFNGPLTFVPGSHRGGQVSTETRAGTSWTDTLSSTLRHQITPATLEAALAGREMVAPKGPRGTVVMFDSLLLHASSSNLSPFDRRMVVLTYNSVENALATVEDPRPEFVAARDVDPLEAVPDHALERRVGSSR
ncbi:MULTISPECIES: phytanoyl-CoA dioxygenase family protein [unclassified Aeromicrobium]|uniref:phytanoyl-CoA dioxygenase family protein n=1 Tax=unclassified Aeromicrobium TaxID=2633570 RepID=UPI002096F6D1|nr:MULTISPECIES: phytanoyl-CoA dioxygenase family protein [unclassified Aeromicrobium]MCO7238562.1 phytanoyl-CoA dioxygenase family protein [Aeromicrobium sp. CnD17-E]MDR6117804.1 ectoine hydroxylase [Aeromicrobium sp. SORGH_AS_0981]